MDGCPDHACVLQANALVLKINIVARMIDLEANVNSGLRRYMAEVTPYLRCAVSGETGASTDWSRHFRKLSIKARNSR